MTYRVRNIVLAVGLALIAALLTTFYVTNYEKRVRSQQQTVPVLVAKADIPVGTTGEDIVKKHLLVTEQVARKTVVPGALASMTQVGPLIVTQAIYTGEQVTQRRFGTIAAAGVRSKLSGTYRAVQIAGDKNQLLVGTLKIGDHVDFLANIKVADEQSSKHFTRIVLRDLPILKLSEQGATAKIGASQASDWVMLKVTDAQSQKLFFATANDDWTLALRPTLNSADSPNDIEDALTVVEAGVKDAEKKVLKGFMTGAALDAASQATNASPATIPSQGGAK